MAEKSTGRFTPKKGDEPVRVPKIDDAEAAPSYQQSGRYTAPSGRSAAAAAQADFEAESAPWVAWLMFAFFAIGLVVIMCNYMFSFLPSSPNNWYLLGGLAAVIAGFITATRLK